MRSQNCVRYRTRVTARRRKTAFQYAIGVLPLRDDEDVPSKTGICWGCNGPTLSKEGFLPRYLIADSCF
jgi:hypothetical protein